MDCNKFNESISDYIDGMLNGFEKREFEEHLVKCIDCKNRYDEMVNIIKSLNDIEEVPLPDNYDEILRNKLEKERINIKKISWAKYLAMAAYVAIVVFSLSIFNTTEKIDNVAQENIDIKQKIISNDKEKIDKEINVASNNKTRKIEKKNVKKFIAKQNENYDKKELKEKEKENDLNVALFESEKTKIDNADGKNDINQAILFKANIDFDINREEVANVGDIITIDLPQNKNTDYVLICNDKDNIVELISESLEVRNNIDIHVWKFKAIKEGKLTLEFKQRKKNGVDKVYKYNISVN
ncbi:zf-HC2 domain-containing protein [Tepidibacter thalassicus]|uniref:Anti-sigma-W factor RsiW n=1 Tax=Tepidibacter thalassicus DSM 15285 TaxID=1123350 RepID=A0A1M5QLJ5_9FIRM|nr:zf-HC2 domain-containing protein [Tepidibacter thalassicus]SHH14473.1 Putative zinc-finger [Tepidibacter thalassicus DSM 15285]